MSTRTRAKLGDIAFEQGFKSWEEAKAASKGYEEPSILLKARDALMKVKRGEAVFERDTVLFDRVQHAHPVLVALLEAALGNGGRLTVLDFGGSLGSSYFQCRSYLSHLRAFRWCIVEQPHFVECGKQYFESEELKFYESIDACVAAQPVDAVLLSGVVEYLPSPLAFLEELARHRFPHIVFDRTPVLSAGAARVTVQHVPASIYKASYPCWFVNQKELLAPLADDYRLINEFTSVDGAFDLHDGQVLFKGFHFRRSSG